MNKAAWMGLLLWFGLCSSCNSATTPQDDAQGQSDTGYSYDTGFDSGSGGDLLIPDGSAADSGTPDGSLDGGNVDGSVDASSDGGFDSGFGDGGANLPPVPKLKYQIDYSGLWTEVSEGGNVTRPLNSAITWNACESYDPDGELMIVWKNDLGTEQEGNRMYTHGETCKNLTDANRTAKDNTAFIRAIDDKGATADLHFYYKTTN